jgi:hypothetical protein
MHAEHFASKLEPSVRLAGLGDSPLVTRERFAEMVGLPVGVIVGWCNKGLIPTMSIGKYSLISLELLRKRCLDREF